MDIDALFKRSINAEQNRDTEDIMDKRKKPSFLFMYTCTPSCVLVLVFDHRVRHTRAACTVYIDGLLRIIHIRVDTLDDTDRRR